MHDLILRRGTIVDGTGRPAFVADVAVKNGVIQAIGDLEEEARELVGTWRLILAVAAVLLFFAGRETERRKAGEGAAALSCVRLLSFLIILYLLRK